MAVLNEKKKPTPMLLCTCDTRGCTENKEFGQMEIESFGPPQLDVHESYPWDDLGLEPYGLGFFASQSEL